MLTHACLHFQMQKILFILMALPWLVVASKVLQGCDILDASALDLEQLPAFVAMGQSSRNRLAERTCGDPMPVPAFCVTSEAHWTPSWAELGVWSEE